MRYALSLFILLSGCAGKLRDDASALSAIQGSYPTAEFNACGSLWHGLGICVVERGSDLSSVNFSVQGYYKGTVRVDSGECAVNYSREYSDSEPIGDILSGSAVRSCVLTITISPQYPGQQNTDVVVSGFRGHLVLKVVEPGESVFTDIYVMPQTFHATFSIKVGETDPVRVFLSGCGYTFDKTVRPGTDGVVRISSLDLVMGRPGVCVVNGFVSSTVYKDLLVAIPVASHYDVFNILPIPKTTYSKGRLSIEADESVGILSVGNEYKLSNSATFKVSDGDIVRALTSKGRSVIGVFSQEKGGVTWKRR